MRAEIPLVVLKPGQVVEVAAGASVSINNRATGLQTTVFAAETGVATLAQPLLTDSQGRVQGWLPRGRYEATITLSGVPSWTEPFEIAPAADGAVDRAWLADGAVNDTKIADATVTNAKIATGLDAAKLTTGIMPIARIGDSQVTGAKIANRTIAAEKMAQPSIGNAEIMDGAVTSGKTSGWHAWHHIAESWFGRGHDTGANSRNRVVNCDFYMPAGCSRVTVAVFCMVQDVRGGYWNGQVIAGIEGVGEREMSVDMGNNFGSFWTMYHPQGLTPGGWYRGFCDFRVGNEPLTMSARGGAVNVWARGQ